MNEEFLRDQGYQKPCADAETAEQIVEGVLGEGFSVEYGTLPKNVGIKGDDGHYGDTVILVSDSDNPAQTFWEHYQIGDDRLTPDPDGIQTEVKDIQETMSQITSSTNASRVLIDVTPPDATPRYITEDKPKKAVPFADKLRTRIEGYIRLKRKYQDQLDDPMMQFAVWAIMDVVDANFKIKMSRKFAEEIRSQSR